MKYWIQPSPGAYAESLYLPLAYRSGIALCLSGGGFRAALFHLGAIRRLNELGILSQVATVAGLSGGSVVTAFLAERLRPWPADPLPPAEWEQRIAAPFRAFASRNLGTFPVLLGWGASWSNAGINLLADRCEERLTGMTLQQLPAAPRFLFCTTDLISGNGRVFERTSREQWLVAKAVAISSCYPGFFPAYAERWPERISLADGGVHDHHAIEPVWKTHEILLVSDGGSVFQHAVGESLLWSVSRSATVVWNQLREVRKRWLIASFISGVMAGTYWGIDSSASHYGDAAPVAVPGYSPALSRDVIAAIRTAYDAFSDVEMAVLENHGYFVAEAAISAHLRRLRRAGGPPKAPHPAWMSEQKVKEALSRSAKWWPPRF